MSTVDFLWGRRVREAREATDRIEHRAAESEEAMNKSVVRLRAAATRQQRAALALMATQEVYLRATPR